RRGEQVASPLVTLVDDGTMGEEWGCFAIDDEGTPAHRNVLIEDGVLTDYMYDFLRSRKEGRPRSGNGRRQSYQHLPMVRMTNTYVLGGRDEPADIVAGTDQGVFVKALGGGQVNTATGDFVFGMTEAYLIENGEITDPLREGNLIGNGPEVLTLIEAIGNDFAMGPPGMCGKDGQGVPVGDGVPTLRVQALTIGDLDLFRESLADFPADAKVELALALERASRSADPRISGVESADYVDSIGEGAVVTSTGIRTAGRETAAYIMASVLAADGDE